MKRAPIINFTGVYLLLAKRVITYLAFALTISLLSTVTPKVPLAASPSLKFNPANLTASVNQEFAAEIVIDTGGQSVGGAGAKLKYNPKVVGIVSIQTGNIFADYPKASFDNLVGTATISGIVASPNQLYNGKDTFAKITFRALSEGATGVDFNFVPGSTTDSNIAVTYGSGDILSEVGNLSLSVTQSQGQTTQKLSPIPLTSEGTVTTQEESSSTGLFGRVIDSIKKTIGLEKSSTDPYAPLSRQDPNTSVSKFQPVEGGPITKGQNNALVIVAVLFLITSMGLAIYLIIKKKKGSKPPQQPTIINQGV